MEGEGEMEGVVVEVTNLSSAVSMILVIGGHVYRIQGRKTNGSPGRDIRCTQ
jgi:hypothetical protein